MKKNSDSISYLFVAGVVAIVAMVALVLSNGNGNLEGAVFAKEKVSPIEIQEFCQDDDPQNEFYKAGTVRHGVFSYIDHCDGDQLHQHYCSTSQEVTHAKHYDCPNGCVNGACLR